MIIKPLYPCMETRFNVSVETFASAYSKHKPGSEDLYGEFLLRPKLTLIPDEQFILVVSADIRQDTAGYIGIFKSIIIWVRFLHT